MKLLVLLGPNMNMVGIREKAVYGTDTAEMIDQNITEWAAAAGFDCDIFQSNHEGELIDKIHSALGAYDGIIINPGALTHYSYSLHDAIAAVEQIPTVEVHMSNVQSRDLFRHNSVISDVCVGVICGFGKYSYQLAIEAFRELI